MILVDQNEARNQPELVNILRQAVDIDIGDYNQSPNQSLVYPDFTIAGGDKLVGINRKTVGEWLSNSDACIEQVQRELAGPVEHLVLLIEGIMRPSPNGMMYAYSLDWNNQKIWRVNTQGAAGQVNFTSRNFSVNPKHAQNEQTRLEFLGVQVVHTYSIQDTASKIISFHDLVMKGEPNRVLDKLYKPDIHVLGLTPQETRFARQLMSMDGTGEELALTITQSFNNITELIRYWDDGGTIADTMLREKANVRTRRIGTAAESRLQNALGYTGVPAPEQEGQGEQVNAVSSTRQAYQ